MYDKKQIIEEIKRVAKKLDTDSLKKKDFIKNTMIPVSTINFYISSWPDALDEAGLNRGKEEAEVKDKDLLEDLLRIENEFGQTPTYALVEKEGKYSKEDYQKKWRNLDDAFKLAVSKYKKESPPSPDKTIQMSDSSIDLSAPDKTIMAGEAKKGGEKEELDMEATLVSAPVVNHEPVQKKDETGSGEFSDNFGSDNILTIEDMESEEEKKKKEEDAEPSFDYVSEDDGGIENLMALDLPKKKKKKKIIPKTIKPSGGEEDPDRGEKINFRGTRFAPVDTRGVIYLFGLVSDELNIVVESFGVDKFCFSAKRKLSLEGEEWEKVNLGFALNSRDMEGSKRLTSNCGLLVCWKHNWDDCPMEVLELSSVLPKLENW